MLMSLANVTLRRPELLASATVQFECSPWKKLRRALEPATAVAVDLSCCQEQVASAIFK